MANVRLLHGLWTDGLGRTAIRAGQLLLLAAATVAVYGLTGLKLLVIPLMTALILAAALNPVVGFLRRRGLPGALAIWVTFLAAVVVLGGVVTGIVFAVRSEWDELAAAAAAGAAGAAEIHRVRSLPRRPGGD